MNIIEIEKGSPAHNVLVDAILNDFARTLRISEDGEPGTLKVKVNEGCWTPPLSTKATR